MKEEAGCTQQQPQHLPCLPGTPLADHSLLAALHVTIAPHRAAWLQAASVLFNHASRVCLAAGVTEIEAGWLAEVAQPLCSFSEPLPEPLPSYSAQADAVLSWRAVSFSSLRWELPPSRGRHPRAEERAAAFGAALLEGSVLPAMKGEHILLQPVHRGQDAACAALSLTL